MRHAMRPILVLTLSIAFGLVFYYEAISNVLSAVLIRNDSSHGVFVPVLTAYFFWTIKEKLRQIPIRFSWLGIPLIIFGIFIAIVQFGNFQIQFIAYIISVLGLVLTILGPGMLKATAFPILFLITMTPLPQDLYNKIADLSRTIAFAGSLKIVSLFDIPHIRTGWDIELPNITLKVAQSCSGIRYLISYVVFGLAYAYLFKSSPVARIATALATIPISIFASIWRLTIIFMMAHWVSPYWGQHKPHVILSWFVFAVVLFGSITIDQMVQKRMGQKRRR
jgi:exosortase